MLTILTDVQLTRRKHANIVVTTKGEVQYSAGRIGDVLDWLREQDHETFNIETVDGNTYRLTLLPTEPLLKEFLNRPTLQTD